MLFQQQQLQTQKLLDSFQQQQQKLLEEQERKHEAQIKLLLENQSKILAKELDQRSAKEKRERFRDSLILGGGGSAFGGSNNYGAMQNHLKAAAVDKEIRPENQQIRKEALKNMFCGLGPAASGSGVGMEMANVHRVTNWFEKEFQTQINDIRAIEILQTFQKWARESLATASHAASTLRIMQQNLDKIICMKQDTTIDQDYQYLYSTFMRSLCQEMDKQRLDGTYLGALPLTRADMKHILNTLIKNAPEGIIRDSYLQAIVQLQFGRLTTRRCIESHHVPLAGVELRFYPHGAIGGDIKHRVIHFVTVWNKGSGVIDAGWSSFADFTKNEFFELTDDGVSIFLVHCARSGFISPQDVLEIYHNKKPLEFVENEFETPEELKSCMVRARNEMNNQGLHLVVNHGGQADAVMREVIDELGYEPEEGLWVDKSGRPAALAATKFYGLVLKFRKESGKKFLFPQDYDQRQRIIRQMTKECGFISNHHGQIGGTSGRKDGINNASTRHAGLLPSENEVDGLVGNNSRTRKKYYNVQQDYRYNVPQNIFNKILTEEDVENFIMRNDPLIPILNRPMHFDSKVPKANNEKIISITDFIAQQIAPLQKRQQLKDTPKGRVPCFVAGCTNSFTTIQDLFSHLKTGCKVVADDGLVSMKCPFGCTNYTFSNVPAYAYSSRHYYQKFNQHIKRHCQHAKSFDILFFSNTKIEKGSGTYHCDGCGESYKRLSNLEEHRKCCQKTSQYDPKAYEASWFGKLDLFVEYVKAIGHGNVQRSYMKDNPDHEEKFESLLQWSSSNRKRKRELSRNKVSLLNQNGFVWTMSNGQENHETRVQEIRDLYLDQLHPEPGMFHVPTIQVNGQHNPTGKWLAKRRSDGGKCMTEQLRQALQFMVGPLVPLSPAEMRRRRLNISKQTVVPLNIKNNSSQEGYDGGPPDRTCAGDKPLTKSILPLVQAKEKSGSPNVNVIEDHLCKKNSLVGDGNTPPEAAEEPSNVRNHSETIIAKNPLESLCKKKLEKRKMPHRRKKPRKKRKSSQNTEGTPQKKKTSASSRGTGLLRNQYNMNLTEEQALLDQERLLEESRRRVLEESRRVLLLKLETNKN
jgi:hypothetical protein